MYALHGTCPKLATATEQDGKLLYVHRKIAPLVLDQQMHNVADEEGELYFGIVGLGDKRFDAISIESRLFQVRVSALPFSDDDPVGKNEVYAALRFDVRTDGTDYTTVTYYDEYVQSRMAEWAINPRGSTGWQATHLINVRSRVTLGSLLVPEEPVWTLTSAAQISAACKDLLKNASLSLFEDESTGAPRWLTRNLLLRFYATGVAFAELTPSVLLKRYEVSRKPATVVAATVGDDVWTVFVARYVNEGDFAMRATLACPHGCAWKNTVRSKAGWMQAEVRHLTNKKLHEKHVHAVESGACQCDCCEYATEIGLYSASMSDCSDNEKSALFETVSPTKKQPVKKQPAKSATADEPVADKPVADESAITEPDAEAEVVAASTPVAPKRKRAPPAKKIDYTTGIDETLGHYIAYEVVGDVWTLHAGYYCGVTCKFVREPVYATREAYLEVHSENDFDAVLAARAALPPKKKRPVAPKQCASPEASRKRKADDEDGPGDADESGDQPQPKPLDAETTSSSSSSSSSSVSSTNTSSAPNDSLSLDNSAMDQIVQTLEATVAEIDVSIIAMAPSGDDDEESEVIESGVVADDVLLEKCALAVVSETVACSTMVSSPDLLEPQSVVEPAPAIELAPVVESVVPVIELAPVVETAPVIELAPIVESAPVIDLAPVIEVAPVAESAQVVVASAPVDPAHFQMLQSLFVNSVTTTTTATPISTPDCYSTPMNPNTLSRQLTATGGGDSSPASAIARINESCNMAIECVRKESVAALASHQFAELMRTRDEVSRLIAEIGYAREETRRARLEIETTRRELDAERALLSHERYEANATRNELVNATFHVRAVNQKMDGLRSACASQEKIVSDTRSGLTASLDAFLGNPSVIEFATLHPEFAASVSMIANLPLMIGAKLDHMQALRAMADPSAATTSSSSGSSSSSSEQFTELMRKISDAGGLDLFNDQPAQPTYHEPSTPRQHLELPASSPFSVHATESASEYLDVASLPANFDMLGVYMHA